MVHGVESGGEVHAYRGKRRWLAWKDMRISCALTLDHSVMVCVSVSIVFCSFEFSWTSA
jgi:hypothetical protein